MKSLDVPCKGAAVHMAHNEFLVAKNDPEDPFYDPLLYDVSDDEAELHKLE